MSKSSQFVLLINKKHRRLVLASFFRSQRAVTHDDHFVARTSAASGSAVETNDTAAGFTGNGICRKSLAVVDVDDVDFFFFSNAACLQKIAVDGNRSDVVEFGLRDGGAMNFRLEHLNLHGFLRQSSRNCQSSASCRYKRQWQTAPYPQPYAPVRSCRRLPPEHSQCGPRVRF